MRRFVPFASLVTALWLVCALAGCAEVARQSVPVSVPPASCAATDQDQYVYDPRRLQVVQSCIHVTGIVQAVEIEPDGDVNLFLRPDPPYRDLLTSASIQYEQGNLVIEPVCVGQPVQSNVMLLCAGDPDPFTGPFPAAGTHVWMEGRYVLDLHHEGHAELHPLYRMGTLSQ